MQWLRRLLDPGDPATKDEHADIRDKALRLAAEGHAEAERSRRRREALQIEVSVVQTHRRGTSDH
jgi:hypothetical protein